MKDETIKLKLYTRRAIILGSVKALFLASTMFRFYYMQIIDGARYRVLSNRNRIRIAPIFAKRGKIFDRNGVVLARNITTFDLHKENPTAQQLDNLEELLDADFKNSSATTPWQINDNKFVYKNLNWDNLVKISTHNSALPGFVVVESSKRLYPKGPLAGHITGYVVEDKARTESGKRGGVSFNHKNRFIKGVTGAESAFETDLHGTIGQKEIEVNSRNSFVREISHTNSVDGKDIKLSIDTRLHNFADSIIGDRQGSIIVQKIENGEILCMYSKPNYDPNMFIKGFTHKQWDEIQADPGHPLLNKSITGIFPPGSIFKIITAIAALQYGIDPNVKYVCKGHHEVASRKFHCWNRRGHGAVDMYTAIQKSCNVYFYKISQIIGMDSIYKAANDLQINGKMGIELAGEQNCFVPAKDWKRKKFQTQWYQGDTINACVGQGYITFTPIGLNTLVSRVASGKLVKPTILSTKGIDTSTSNFTKLDVMEEYLQIVRDGMYMATNGRSGSSADSKLNTKGFELCGKTGTAQVVSLQNFSKNSNKHGLQDHSLFNGFAPYRNPKYAITVVIEHGTWGSRAAAPAAKKMMEYFYEIYGA